MTKQKSTKTTKSTKAKKTKAPVEGEVKVKKKRGRKPKKEYYVEPAVFTAQIVQYYDDLIITDELGLNIYNIANRLCYAPNFINYTYREEMVGDAVVKMFTALKNQKFDPAKGNSFSYYTKIAFNACCNRIKKEKRQREVIHNYQEEVYSSLSDTDYAPNDSTKRTETGHEFD